MDNIFFCFTFELKKQSWSNKYQINMLKKNNLKYYIALMTFALVGLVVLQYQFLQKAYQTNQEKFKYNVQMALNNIANSLPFAEANYYVALAKKDSNTCENPQDLVVNIPPIVETKKQNISPPTPPKKIIPQEAVQSVNFDKEIPLANASFVNEKNIYPPNNTIHPDFEQYLSDLENFNTNIQNQEIMLTNLLKEQQNFFDVDIRKQLQNININTHVRFDFDSLMTKSANISRINGEHLGVNVENIGNQVFINISSKNLKTIKPEDVKSVVITSNKKSNKKSSEKETKKNDKKTSNAVIIPIPSEKFVSEKDASCQPNTQTKILQSPLTIPTQKVIQVKEKKDIFKLALKFEETDERKKNMEKRLQNIAFEERIKKEFKQRGIHLNYNFEIKNRKRTQETTHHNASFSDEKTKFQVELFPLEQNDKQYFLQVKFADLASHYVENMWQNLFTSLLFIALIIFCFAKAISTILKQKKIAQITNDFINNMTHELKTPISTVSLACEALQDKDIQQIAKQRERYLNIIEEENKRLGSQVERVLQIAKLDKGDVELSIETVNAHEIITQAIEKIELQIESRGGKITTEFLANEPFLKADEVHLTNIILNLLDNANKYSPEKPEINIKTENVKNGIKISIADKGKGMNKEQQAKVFEKFYRVPTGNVHNVKGFGLGLSYVKMMTQAQQGTIDLKSEQGKGSIFSLEFQNEKINCG
ncbi:MAG: sensor histidine kinase [Bacteroidetes bacterium]|nr:MAG: sensor histidine kinase [Bacteroidota bacterium]TAG94219.1 MAG: sensor histidine kinase [Bacteroidota bacterium]